jgi:hypothetical protein
VVENDSRASGRNGSDGATVNWLLSSENYGLL